MSTYRIIREHSETSLEKAINECSLDGYKIMKFMENGEVEWWQAVVVMEKQLIT